MNSATLTRDELIAAGKVHPAAPDLTADDLQFIPYREIDFERADQQLADAFATYFHDLRANLCGNSDPNTLPKRYYEYPEAAAYLRMKVPTLQKKVYNKEITYAKLGASVVFDIIDLDEYVASHKIKAKKVRSES